MSRQERLLETLGAGRRLCDDCLSDISGIKPRQSVYQACSTLRDNKVISRMTESCEACHRMKTTNALISPTPNSVEAKPSQVAARPATSSVLVGSHTTSSKPWYWEGNVQAVIVRYLTASKATVLSQANTSTREQGKDIEANDADGSLLWITVKGFPEKSKNVQARHWFAGTLLDLALYKDQNPEARLAIGLPRGFSTYENLVRRVRYTLALLGCHIFWVSESGAVTREVVRNNGH